MTQSGHCTSNMRRRCHNLSVSVPIGNLSCISFTRCEADRPHAWPCWCGEVATTEPMVRRPVVTTRAPHCTRGRCSLFRPRRNAGYMSVCTRSVASRVDDRQRALQCQGDRVRTDGSFWLPRNHPCFLNSRFKKAAMFSHALRSNKKSAPARE